MIWRNYGRIFLQNHRAFAAETGRSPARQLIDIARMRLKGVMPREYYGHTFVDGVPPQYLGIRQYRDLERWLNPRYQGVIQFDKWHQAHFFRSAGIPHPDVFGFILARRGILGGTAWHGDNEVLAGFLRNLDTPFVTKLVAGGHGDDFDIVDEISGEHVVLRRGGRKKLNELVDQLAANPSGILFQAVIRQHPDIGRIAPSAVNTVRILTFRDRNGHVEFPAAIMKFARHDAHVDNMGAGGIAAHVDIETGELDVAFEWPGKREYERHPDTGEQIAGMRIPYFAEAKAVVARAHQAMTSAASLGWDVAITKDGPIVLEFNGHVLIPVYQRRGRWLGGSALGKAYEAYRAAGGRPFQPLHRPF